ncbi:hypothetical protein EDB82DRAFT_86979 [Fusarium venenatum]|uniref:uncharacterized protein n=1 Tax=Fusarium venenatum TaxID=56646 RepID=UPI001D8A21C0|nr:hypothetical protein EDB82DRAFT_86979 [Fusarium venenatum]
MHVFCFNQVTTNKEENVILLCAISSSLESRNPRNLETPLLVHCLLSVYLHLAKKGKTREQLLLSLANSVQLPLSMLAYAYSYPPPRLDYIILNSTLSPGSPSPIQSFYALPLLGVTFCNGSCLTLILQTFLLCPITHGTCIRVNSFCQKSKSVKFSLGKPGYSMIATLDLSRMERFERVLLVQSSNHRESSEKGRKHDLMSFDSEFFDQILTTIRSTVTLGG